MGSDCCFGHFAQTLFRFSYNNICNIGTSFLRHALFSLSLSISLGVVVSQLLALTSDWGVREWELVGGEEYEGAKMAIFVQ